MPGQQITDADHHKIELKYMCIVCGLLLSEPMQTPCGHLLCFVCLHMLLSSASPTCPSDGTILEEGSIFPDIFMKREMMKLLIHCPNEGCDWSGTYQDITQEHSTNCNNGLIRCTHALCKKGMKRSLLAQHLETHRHRQLTCEDCKCEKPAQQDLVDVEGEETPLTLQMADRTQQGAVGCEEIPATSSHYVKDLVDVEGEETPLTLQMADNAQEDRTQQGAVGCEEIPATSSHYVKDLVDVEGEETPLTFQMADKAQEDRTQQGAVGCEEVAATNSHYVELSVAEEGKNDPKAEPYVKSLERRIEVLESKVEELLRNQGSYATNGTLEDQPTFQNTKSGDF